MEKDKMVIDYSNHNQLVDLMNHADDYPYMLTGENQNGEFTTTSITPDCIILETLQDNGWIRKNVYYCDGLVEEIYHDDVVR